MRRYENECYQGIGKRIRYYRNLRGLSQIQLGKQLNITFQQFQKYEKGMNRISIYTLEEIARLLDISYNDLRGSDDEQGNMQGITESELDFLSSFKRLPIKQAKAIKELINSILKKE